MLQSEHITNGDSNGQIVYGRKRPSGHGEAASISCNGGGRNRTPIQVGIDIRNFYRVARFRNIRTDGIPRSYPVKGALREGSVGAEIKLIDIVGKNRIS